MSGRRLAALLLVAGAVSAGTNAASVAGAFRYRGSATGIPVPVFPTAAGIGAAESFLDGRAGSNGFAVVDTQGQLSGVRMHDRFHSASLVKAMLLVAYLRMLDAEHRRLDSTSTSLLYPMIHVSDNNAASAVFGIVGGAGLTALAHAAGMTDFALDPGGAWGLTEISAADQARFFYEQDRLIPTQFDSYARGLLSGISSDQSWGIPAAARPAFQVFFKGGWLPETGWTVNQAARLERPGQTIALSVLTAGDPSMLYGEQTLQGATARLLGA
jgi:hypothetical protein